MLPYQVAVGGFDGILCPSLSEKLRELYEAIASVAAKPKPEEAEKNSEHILEDFHSSRTIRRLVLDCPAFASILFKKALSGQCRLWAQGHWLAPLITPLLIYPFTIFIYMQTSRSLKFVSVLKSPFSSSAVQRYYLLS